MGRSLLVIFAYCRFSMLFGECLVFIRVHSRLISSLSGLASIDPGRRDDGSYG
jgi:hypothetical protein